jgi:outer membrane protein OmpA-like peptidoglycan-associated protein/Tol biopolymer transport system component
MIMKFAKTIILVTLLKATSSFSQEAAKAININTPEFHENSPAFSSDGKSMIFQSNREGGFKLYESTLQNDGQWSSPVSIKEINGFNMKGDPIGGPSLSSDGKTLYFCALDEGGFGDMDLYFSRKNGDSWSRPSNMGDVINTKNYEGFPSISPDGKSIYFMTHMISADNKPCYKLMMSEADKNGKWQSPKEIQAPVNISCNKTPFIMGDNKSLLFASDRSGNFDLFRSTMGPGGNWGEPLAYKFSNTINSESFASVVPAGDNLYYSTGGDIYSMNIPASFRLGKSLTGTVLDGETNKPIKSVFFIKNSDTKDTLNKTEFNPADPKYKIMLMAGKNYEVIASAPNYNDTSFTFYLKDRADLTAVENNIILKARKKKVVLNIADSETNKGLKVKIKITNLDTDEQIIVENTVGRDGKYAVNLREGNRYNVEVSSQEGYAFSNTNIAIPGEESGSGNERSANMRIQNLKEDQLENVPIKVLPIRTGTKLLLHDIFFEFNSFTLQDTSFKELDRVIGLLKENPGVVIEIAAHSDDIGSDEFNLKLSGKRASIIVDYLVNNGISKDRLKPVGYGKKFPVATNATEEGRAKNRRLELKVVEIRVTE